MIFRRRGVCHRDTERRGRERLLALALAEVGIDTALVRMIDKFEGV